MPQPRTYTQLQPEDRVSLVRLKQQNYSIRAMAKLLDRPTSTISRELQRNSTAGQYASTPAQQACKHRRLQARPLNKLHPEGVQFGAVEHTCAWRWSPEQIALTSQRLYPKGHPHRMSHETIYNCIYAQPVGALRRDLIACLRHAHNKRVSRSKGADRRWQIPNTC